MNPRPAQVCHGCEKSLDEIHPTDHPTPWVEAGSFLVTYGFTWNDLDLQQRFCPGRQKAIETTCRRNQPKPDPTRYPD